MSLLRATLIALLAIAATAFASLPADASPMRAAGTPCGRISGPAVHWQGKLLHHYVVAAYGSTPCSFAKRWVTIILHEKTANGSLGQPVVPAGERCLGNTVGHIAFNGACHAGVRGFSWGAL